MRICLISQDYLPNPGGIASHVDGLSQALSRSGHEVTLLTIRRDRMLPPREDFGRVRIHRFLAPDISKARGAAFLLQAAAFLRGGTPADVIHWHNILPDSIAAWAGRSAVKVFTNHSSRFLEDYDAGRNHLLYRLVLRQAQAIIAPSQELRAKSIEYLGKPPEQVFYVPNAVDADVFSPCAPEERRRLREELSARYGLAKDAPWILCPRRLDRKNGVANFIEAAPKVLSEPGPVQFLIVGGGAERRVLEGLIEAKRLDGRVRMTGSVPQAEMPRFYRAADMAVIPSLKEATSIAGLEAMACELPVIASAIGGLPEIVSNGETGLLVPPSDPSGLAAAMRSLLKDEALRARYGKAGRRKVLKDFTWAKIASQTLEIYARAKA